VSLLVDDRIYTSSNLGTVAIIGAMVWLVIWKQPGGDC
jgi:hypothetical protein